MPTPNTSANPNFSQVSTNTPTTAAATMNAPTLPSYTAPTSITSPALVPQTQVKVPPRPTPTVPNTNGGTAMIATNNATTFTTPSGAKVDMQGNIITPAPTAPTNPASDFQSLLTQFLGSSTTPPSSSDEYAKEFAASPITADQTQANTDTAAVQTAQDNLTGINTQLAGLNAEATAIPIQDQQDINRLVTKGGIAPQTAGELRMNALKALPLQAQVLGAQAAVAAAQGRANLSQSILQQAQTQLDKVFQLHMTDATNQYNYQDSLRKTVYDYATAAEKTILDAQTKAADQNFTLMQNNLNNAQALAKSAIDAGQADVAAKITALDPHSSTYQQDVATLSAQIKPQPTAATDQWSAPFSLNGNSVQKNLTTGEIKTVSSRAPGSAQTITEKTASATANFQNAFQSGVTMPNGISTVDSNGNITPEAWLAAINDAPAEGLTRADFIKAFGSQITADDGTISKKYGLTPADLKLLGATAR